MGKIKLNLESGASIEKPLINAFTENGNTYVVFDNETNGSMGLPIILVSKLLDNKLVKIVDQGEWQLVKEYLKNIIASGKSEFVQINSELKGDDVYFTQLTLPVPSFDALKKAYPFNDESVDISSNPIADAINNSVEENKVNDTVSEETSVNNELNNPIQSPIVETQPINVEESAENQIVNPVANIPNPGANLIQEKQDSVVSDQVNSEVIPNNDIEFKEDNNAIAENNNLVDNPSISESKEAVIDNPLFNIPLSEENKSVEKEPEITPTPIIETNIQENSVIDNDIFKDQKEAFMKACENMFDALVQKFEKELENRK